MKTIMESVRPKADHVAVSLELRLLVADHLGDVLLGQVGVARLLGPLVDQGVRRLDVSHRVLSSLSVQPCRQFVRRETVVSQCPPTKATRESTDRSLMRGATRRVMN